LEREEAPADNPWQCRAREVAVEVGGEEPAEDLRAEAEEAESFNDSHRAGKARAEIESISRELSAAFGLGGRARKASSDGERARLMVTQRIKATLKKIGEENETVGRHLANAIRTGNFCSYEAAEGVAWAL